jgi:phospholipid/cholesterol/gamma-HCH transport system substrate-binding protein
MKEPRSEFKIGLTVLLAFAILITSILWGKQFYFTTGTYTVDVRFQDIAGLDQGVSVLVNGVHRGKVSDLILLREGVIVRLAIQKSVVLYNDARFEIVSPELMGGKVVNVFPGISGEQPPDGFIFVGKVGGDMNELMRRSADLVNDVKSLLVALEMTAENINKTAGDPRLQEALLSSVRNFDESSQRTLEFLTLNEGKLTEVMDNLVVSTEAIRELVENRADDIHEAVIDFDLFVSQLNELAYKLDQVVTKLQSEDGTLGILLNDDDLAVTLERTLVDLDSLVRQIKDEGIETNIHLFGRRR